MPRRNWTAEEKMTIVLEGLAPNTTIAEVCRRHKVAQTQFYRWRDAFLPGGKSALVTGPSTREQELEAELRAARAKVGEQTLEIDILKKKTSWGRR